MRPLYDYHIHTPYCKHASATMDEYHRAARERGIGEICFTCHTPAWDGFHPEVRMEPDEYPLYQGEVEGLRGFDGPDVLLGIEADYYLDCEPVLATRLAQQSFDLVLGSVHYEYPVLDPARRYEMEAVEQSWISYYDLVALMVRSSLFDVVSHFDFLKRNGHSPAPLRVLEIVNPLLEEIAESGMVLEINTSGLRNPPFEMYPSPQILRAARRHEIPICFGSDAHDPAHVGMGMEEAVRLAYNAGYTGCVRFRRREKWEIPLSEFARE